MGFHKEKEQDKVNTVKFGYDQISKTGKCGMPESHMEAMMKAAKKMESPIMIRPVSPFAAYFLKNGYPTKPFIIKNKSAKTGIGAGLILVNPKFSHIQKKDYEKHNEKLDNAIEKDKHHGNVLEATPLVLPQERVNQLLNELHCITKDETYTNTRDPAIKKYTWIKEEEPGTKITVEAYARPAAGKPGSFEFFEDEACDEKPIKVMAEKIKNKEGFEETRAISADYDLFAVLPKWKALHQELSGDMKAEWAGLYDFALTNPDKGRVCFEAIPSSGTNDENSPIIKYSILDNTGKLIEENFSKKELKEMLQSSEFEKVSNGEDLLEIMNKNKLKVLDVLSERGHVEALRKAPIEKRPFRTQGDVKENQEKIIEEYVKSKKEGEAYAGPKEHELQGNVNLRTQSAISVINTCIANLDSTREGVGLNTVHHNDETHNPYADSLKDNMPILLFLPEDIRLGLQGELKNEPLLIQSVDDLKYIRERLQESGFYWPTHARFKEELPAFKNASISTGSIFAGLNVSQESVQKDLAEKVEKTPDAVMPIPVDKPVNATPGITSADNKVDMKEEQDKEQVSRYVP